jgi:Ca2+/Na+ antiporter
MDRVQAGLSLGDFQWKGKPYTKQFITNYSTGQIVEYQDDTREEFCHSIILFPGFSLQQSWWLGTLYFITLVYIFVGVSIISDIFMDSITVITSAKRVVQVRDENANIINKEVIVWNSTIANLTLMALGSSAPEIMLNVIETVMTLGSKPGELGASTIVGSAAFNLLVISGVSIMAVTAETDERTPEEIEEDGTDVGVKKIGKTKVFAVTTVFSVLAYVWMYIVLKDEVVEPYEAWVTLALFPVLIIMALIADKLSSSAEKIDPAATLPVMNTLEFIEVLKNEQPEDQMAPAELQRKSTLKTFLKTEMGTDNINEVNLAQLKEKIEGNVPVKKGEYRKAFGSQLQGKKKFND